MSLCFNPRVREGRDRAGGVPDEPVSRFNPRVREGRDCVLELVLCINPVSIHASVKDATCYDFCDVIMTRVSIHASVKDATEDLYLTPDEPVFQSTRP